MLKPPRRCALHLSTCVADSLMLAYWIASAKGINSAEAFDVS